MKKLRLLILGVVFLAACFTRPTSTPTPTPTFTPTPTPTFTPPPTAFLGSSEVSELCSLRKCPAPTSAPTPTPTPTFTPTPTPTRKPKPTPTPTPTPLQVACPPTMTCGLNYSELWGKNVKFYRGDGYEIIDASENFDIIIKRDVLGPIIRAIFHDSICGEHKLGVRIHIADPIYKPECGASPLAPMEFWQRWPGPCGNYFYYDAFGDGAGAQIYLGRTWAICHDPDEGFIAIGSGGPHLTDIVVTGFVVLYVGSHYTPDFRLDPMYLALGRPYREGDQWRWEDPFIEVIPAR